MIVSCVAFATMWALIRIASAELHPFEIVFFRNAIGCVVLTPMLLRHPGLLKSARMPIHLRRATSGLVATLATFFAIASAPLATVLAINYTAPLFATLLAVLLLGERIHARRIAALLVGFGGMLIVLRPGAAPLTVGIAAAMVSAVSTGFSIVAIRSLVGSDDSRAVAAWSFLLTVLPSLGVAAFVWRWPSLHVWPVLLAIGVVAAIGQLTLSRAFSLSEASAILPYDFVRFGLITAFGIGLFGEHYDLGTFVGGAVILAVTIYLAYREAQVGRRLAAAARAS